MIIKRIMALSMALSASSRRRLSSVDVNTLASLFLFWYVWMMATRRTTASSTPLIKTLSASPRASQRWVENIHNIHTYPITSELRRNGGEERGVQVEQRSGRR